MARRNRFRSVPLLAWFALAGSIAVLLLFQLSPNLLSLEITLPGGGSVKITESSPQPHTLPSLEH
jgi:uncharacterized membrane protein